MFVCVWNWGRNGRKSEAAVMSSIEWGVCVCLVQVKKRKE